MLGLKILFWIVAILLALVFIVAFMNSTAKDRSASDRQTDLIVGVVVFLVFIALIKVFGGYVI